MALPPGKRGAFGDWLKSQRERRYSTQEQARAEYRRLAGLAIGASEYAQWESGSRVPGPTNAKRLALYAFYGSREEQPEVEEPKSEMGQLIAAITAQTKALDRIAALLEARISPATEPEPEAAGDPDLTELLPGLARTAAASERRAVRLAGEAARKAEDKPSVSRRGSRGSTRH